MRWVHICDTVVDVERYRLFRLIDNMIIGLNEFEMGTMRSTEPVAMFDSNEQAEQAFEDLVSQLLCIQSD